MKFDELYKKVIESCKAFEERQIPISLDFKIEDLRDALVESNDTIEKLKAKLDKAIAERDGNQVCIDALKQKLENVQESAYADSVDAGMRERRLRRAFYKACANWAHFAVAFFCSYTTKEKWYRMELKCRKKSEEYK